MRDPEDLENDIEDLESTVAELVARVEALEKVTGQEQFDPTCGGLHPPLAEIWWPGHCHTRSCPRCGGSYPI